MLNRESGQFSSLSAWHLIIGELSVLPLNANAAELPLSGEIFCQGCFISEAGEEGTFANASSVIVPASNGDALKAVVSGINVISLEGREGTTIELDSSSGILAGPNNSKLFFSGLNKLVIPAPAEPQAPAYVIPQAQEIPEAFVFTQAQAANGEQAQTEKADIVIKTGYSLYGWNVAFENGMTMSLADVRAYQSKHHALPDKNGVISYGKASLSFKNAERITAYERPSYCAYGLSPAV